MRKFLSVVLALSLSSISCKSQQKVQLTQNSKPKLVVGIVVDQLRADYLYRFNSRFTHHGFKRMINDGFVCYNTFYTHMPTHTGPGHASIFTGASPSLHGIIANDWIDPFSGDTINCVEDLTVQPLGSSNEINRRSPVLLKGTGIADELKYAQQFKSKSIGISLKDRGAILPASHSANAAYWFDSKIGQFVSSTYYMNELPKWVVDFNQLNLPKKYLSEDWTTLLPMESYYDCSSDDNPYEGTFSFETRPVFPHAFSKMNPINYNVINYSPAGNTLTSDFAIRCMVEEKMGLQSTTDFISISYSATDYIGHMHGTDAIELADCMLRLDLELQRLFTFLDATYGKENYVCFLTSDHGAKSNPAYLKDNKIPGSIFDQKGLIGSVKQFLKETYGRDSLCLGIIKHMIYLDHQKMESFQIDPDEASEKLANFLEKNMQIAQVLTRKQLEGPLLHFPANLLQQSYHSKRSADVLIIYNQELLQYQTTGTQHISPYTFDTHVPLLWMGWKIKHGRTYQKVNINDIAPTLSTLLQISWPSGTNGKVIEGIFE
ncbi:MAG TPA: alkaline phosphatase family protein [Bacteroidia bacterium]|nr:alkaline phosphatase family protein [Bacteroidia bacterium]HNT79919.1 alkaline phosphatase family protein [Bacteroidia bacterium]